MPRGREEFLFKKSFVFEFDEIPGTQGVHGRSKSSRKSSSEGITQGVHGSGLIIIPKSQKRQCVQEHKKDPDSRACSRKFKGRSH
jgi:hypothetical protein